MADEEFEDLKKEADKAPEKYRNALRFLRNHTFNFDMLRIIAISKLRAFCVISLIGCNVTIMSG